MRSDLLRGTGLKTKSMASPSRHSGLQKGVFSLYRKLLREAAAKDRATTSESLVGLLSTPTTSTAYASTEFRKQAQSVPRNDFKRIEYMVRKGEKHLKLLKMPGVKMVGGTA